jgi:catechol 2,3-dioxygenase-like lactoylglutathione lyase family enzyme
MMSRIQLALNVADLRDSIDFYTKLFDTPPAKVHEGYANFAIADPPLKLVLFEGAGAPGTLNHVGVEVDSPADVAAASSRISGEGLDQRADSGPCCFSAQEKVWIDGPDNAWEIYTVLDGSHTTEPLTVTPAATAAAKATAAESACC